MYNSNLLPAAPFLGNQKQSRLGIAAFILGLLAFLMFCSSMLISLGYGVSLVAENPTGDPITLIDPESPIILIASGLICLSPILSLVGTGLGIAAALQKTDKRTFGIIGLVINGLVLLSFCGLFALGMFGPGGYLGV